jgi:RNA polymerase sigma-70 factor (ECF subfamily)
MTDTLDQVYERVLVLRCQTGDERAFEELVQRYHARLRAFVAKMLSDAYAVDDVLQDVWLDVFRKVVKLRDTGAFRAWVYRIARDRAYRHLRRRHRAVSLSIAGEASRGDAAAEVEFDSEEIRCVHASLDRLPLVHRDVLWLRFVEQMSYEQIATAVGCELGTVRSRLHYAKRALRELIERNDHEPR